MTYASKYDRFKFAFRYPILFRPHRGGVGGGGIHSSVSVPLVYAGMDSLEDGCEFGVGVGGMAAEDFLEALVVNPDLDAASVVGPVGVVDPFSVRFGWGLVWLRSVVGCVLVAVRVVVGWLGGGLLLVGVVASVGSFLGS